MKLDPELVKDLPDPLREKVSLPVGDDAGYYVGDSYSVGDKSVVVDDNTPPGQLVDTEHLSYHEIYKANEALIKTGSAQPYLWCQWIPNDDGTAIEWDGSEKFYYYVEWIKYLIDHFLGPWGISVNSTVCWQGENDDDKGKIDIVNNRVKTIKRSVIWKEEEEDNDIGRIEILNNRVKQIEREEENGNGDDGNGRLFIEIVSGSVTWKGDDDNGGGRIEIVNGSVKKILEKENRKDELVQNEKEGEESDGAESAKIELQEGNGNDEIVENKNATDSTDNDSKILADSIDNKTKTKTETGENGEVRAKKRKTEEL